MSWLGRLLRRLFSRRNSKPVYVGVDLGVPGSDRNVGQVVEIRLGQPARAAGEPFVLAVPPRPTMHAARRRDHLGAMAFGPLCGAAEWELVSVEAVRVECSDCLRAMRLAEAGRKARFR